MHGSVFPIDRVASYRLKELRPMFVQTSNLGIFFKSMPIAISATGDADDTN